MILTQTKLKQLNQVLQTNYCSEVFSNCYQREFFLRTVFLPLYTFVIDKNKRVNLAMGIDSINLHLVFHWGSFDIKLCLRFV